MKKSRTRYWAGSGWACCVFCMLAAPAYGTERLLEMPLEQLLDLEVSGASRFTQTSRTAPSAVTVVTREQIRDHAWSTLSEVLDAVPGLFTASDRIYRFLGVRGFLQPSDYNTNILLLIDGIPVNDGVYNQALLGSEGPVDLALVERVEFIPGPGSSVYGSNAILGVINVVTIEGRTARGPSVTVSAGSNGEREAAVRYGFADDRRDTLFSASGWRSDGENITLPAAGGEDFGRARGLEGERGQRLALRHAWDQFTLLALHADRRKGYATAPYETLFGDSRTRARDAQWLVSLSHDGEWHPGINVLSRVLLGGAKYRGDWAYSLPEGLNRDRSESRWWGVELQATDLRFGDHTLIYGLEYRNEYRLRQSNADLGPDPDDVHLDDRRQAQRVGLYVQDEWRLDGWRINVGLRADRYSSFGTTLSPRFGLIQELSPRTTLKYLVGTAYRAPNVFEMHYHDGDEFMKANPNLEPERVRSLELALDHEDKRGWQWRGSLFHNRIDRLIGQELDDGDGLLVYRNRGSVTVHGLTVGVQRSWQGGARLALSTSWHDARDRAAGTRLSHSPRHIAKIDATLPVSTWRVTVEGRHIGSRTGPGRRVSAQQWANFALVSADRAVAGARVSLRVNNLFDRRLYDPASEEFLHDRLPRERRHARVTFEWPL